MWHTKWRGMLELFPIVMSPRKLLTEYNLSMLCVGRVASSTGSEGHVGF